MNNAPPQMLCDLVILWCHMLWVGRLGTAAPAGNLKTQLEAMLAHGGKYTTAGARAHPEPARPAHVLTHTPLSMTCLAPSLPRSQRTRTRCASSPSSCPRS
jgi:hypothetical protein